MKSGRFLMFIAALVLAGCAGLEQYPETTKDYKADLTDLDPEYQAALVEMYATTDAAKKKDIRDRLVEERMAVIDSKYETFEASLTKESVAAQLGIALVGIGVGAAGSFAAETASQMLSAASGGLAGAQAAYEKSVFYDRAFTALVMQMRAGRKVIEAQIFERRKLSIEDYPLWLARSDLQAYIFAGSLPGALVGTAADASVKEKEAELTIARSGEFAGKLKDVLPIQERLINLTPTQALALAKIMEPNLASRPEKLQDFLRDVDPTGEHLKTGEAAKQFLLAWQIQDDRDDASIKQWSDGLDSVASM